MVSGRTKLLGLIGHPIGHSLSPRMHNAAFAADVMEADAAEYVYVAMEVQPDRLSAAVRGLVALGFVGFNVPMSHKEAILPLMDKVDTPARLAGAVNTVSVADEGRLRGLNTDGSGFVEACKEVAVSLEGRRVLVLGAGGTAAAIAVAALGAGATQLYIANRTAGRAEQLRLKLSEAVPETEVLTCPLDRAGEAAARTVSGDRMLLYQGVQAQRVWTAREPNIEAMSDALRFV